MRVFVFIILSLIVVALLVWWWPRYKVRARTIDAVDLFRLADARRAGTSSHQRQARWAVAIVIAIVLVALFWHLLSRGG